jgi:DNA-binding LytR/AlgR family response regulator
MKCIIIDDDELSRFHLKTLLDGISGMETLGVFESVGAAISTGIISETELIFLDIEMPEMSGIDFIKTFTSLPQVVIVSTKKDYAVEGFEYQVSDYIVKPVQLPRLVKAIDTCRKKNQSTSIITTHKDYFFIKKGSLILKIIASEIDYIEALGDYVNIYLGKIKHTISMTMKEMEIKLPNDHFCRIHKSYIIRMDKVNEFEENTVSINGKVLPVSRHYKESFVKKLALLN